MSNKDQQEPAKPQEPAKLGRPPGPWNPEKSTKVQVKRINWWHERFIDWLIANPNKHIREAAVEFGVTPQWLYMLKNTDMFQDEWRRRSRAHSEALTGTIRDKAFALAEMAIDGATARVQEQLAHGVLTTREALDIVEVTMRRFGYGEGKGAGGAAGAPANVTINLGLLSPDQIAQARARLRGEAVEVEALTDEREAPLEPAT